MQPWDFVVIRDEMVEQRIHRSFVEANDEAAALFEPERSVAYRKLKPAGIPEAPLGICVHERAELEKRGWAKRTNFRKHVAWDSWT